jgi:2-polyprenyl-6-hydroxyphenyl methylase / 3-demethylubiquinone-9 3-methyltransferase
LLQKLNPVRIPYFDRIWRKVLGNGIVADPKKKFLDAGCGGGIATEALAQLGYQMVGLDVSEGSVEVARKHAEENLVQNAQYKVGSIYQIPFEDSTFEGVISSDVFVRKLISLALSNVTLHFLQNMFNFAGAFT